ncbi:nucleoside phosphorylase domain-containing protein [Xylaria curta]|nr:nucleoside phosphorylase domain-containing protein [Xylaria curta]
MASLIQKTPDEYTVAIICAMGIERDAVRYMLDNEHQRLRKQPGDSNTYTLGELQGHNIVLVCLPGQQGNSSAATVSTNLSRSFPSVKWRLFVGVGGGVPSAKHDIRLGDVVISMPEGEYPGVVQYDLGRETTSGFELKGFLWPIPALLRNAAQDMHSDHIGRDNKNMIAEHVETMVSKSRGLNMYRKPDKAGVRLSTDSPPLFRAIASYLNQNLPQTGAHLEREPDGPMIHYGLIASGDSVIKNTARRDEIARRVGREVLCFEMEAAGTLTEHPAIVIRGISDYADPEKNKDWQPYASATAAACAKELLSYIDPEEALVEKPAPAPIPKQELPASMVFHGRGIQNTGNISFGGNFQC